eukprot:CAMPEP_0195523152 /NCGR_PEP_ID=MMETSP0794_2-20130614/22036_1 /TAXON_ID=515487 /ORGANISM="Stephanopyxis turris, Strain CCMP 815" /LENGTH=315 /DNA_ID=CAMNT_0040653071 /DNA_START=36 /DNA_END=983 /DNA_ORIENTATION=+
MKRSSEVSEQNAPMSKRVNSQIEQKPDHGNYTNFSSGKTGENIGKKNDADQRVCDTSIDKWVPPSFETASSAHAYSRSNAPFSKDTYSRANIAKFIQKTYDMIKECEPTIAAWTNDGRMVLIKDVKSFEKEYIPRFFSHSNFSSFKRQMNFYGFTTVLSKPVVKPTKEQKEIANYVGFQHDHFRRDRKDLLPYVQRKSRSTVPCEPYIKNNVEALKKKVVDISNHIQNLESYMESLFSGLISRVSVIEDRLFQLDKKVRDSKYIKVTNDDIAESQMNGFESPFAIQFDGLNTEEILQICPIPLHDIPTDKCPDNT